MPLKDSQTLLMFFRPMETYAKIDTLKPFCGRTTQMQPKTRGRVDVDDEPYHHTNFHPNRLERVRGHSLSVKNRDFPSIKFDFVDVKVSQYSHKVSGRWKLVVIEGWPSVQSGDRQKLKRL
jgi:hypothetical protein